MLPLGSLTTHSTGARVSLHFIENLSLLAVRRARLIRALGAVCFRSRIYYDANVITTLARLGGLLFTLVFFWLEILCALNIRHFERVARELPQPYRQAAIWDKKKRLLWMYATWSLYFILVIFWVVALFRNRA